jgi:hypothetical protein
VYNLVSEGSIESRIAGIVDSKRILFKGVFDGTTNEVRFEGEASFAAEVRRLLDLTLPDAPEVKRTQPVESDAVPEDTTSELSDVADSDVVAEVAVASVVTAPMIEETSTAQRLETDESTAADGSNRVPGEERASRTPEDLPRPHEVQKLFEQLRISQTDDGGLRVEAPKETALTLATVLESLGRLLRDSANS